MTRTELVLTLAGVIFASTGFWNFIISVWQEKNRRKSSESKLLMGIAYRQIIEAATFYIRRGWINADEYNELNRYLFEPYSKNGGNGTAEKMMKQVAVLPMEKEENHDRKQ